MEASERRVAAQDGEHREAVDAHLLQARFGPRRRLAPGFEQGDETVCHAGMRSAQAAVILKQAGFERVANLRGGMLLWEQLGLPVTRETGSAH